MGLGWGWEAATEIRRASRGDVFIWEVGTKKRRAGGEGEQAVWGVGGGWEAGGGTARAQLRVRRVGGWRWRFFFLWLVDRRRHGLRLVGALLLGNGLHTALLLRLELVVEQEERLLVVPARWTGNDQDVDRGG